MKSYDESAVNTLLGYIIANSYILRQYTLPTLTNLAKHYAAGEWDEKKALRSMRNLSKKGAQYFVKQAVKQFRIKGSSKWSSLFSVADRIEVATRLLNINRNYIHSLAQKKAA